MGKSIEEEILKELDSDVATILATDVHHAVSEAHKEVVENDWYDMYEPRIYKRRKERKGLIDENNFQIGISGDIQNGMTYTFENITKDNPYGKFGFGYEPFYSSLEGENFLIDMIAEDKLRPINNKVELMDLTVELLEGMGEDEKALVEGLKKLGWKAL